MKATVNLGNGCSFELEAEEGRMSVNGREVSSQKMQELGEAVHRVRVAADMQAATIRRPRGAE